MEFTALFVCLTALVLVPAWLRQQTRIATLKLMGEAVAKGQPIDPALAAQLAIQPKSDMARWFAYVCLFCGLPSLTIGIGIGLAFWLFPDALAGFSPHDRTQMLQPALYGGSAGFGLTILGFLAPRLFPRNADM